MHENDMQLPYDRCVKIDQEVDALLEEEKKKQQLNERKAKLIEDSKKSRHFAIYKWLGPNLMLERVCGNILWFVLCVSTGFLIAIFDFGNDYKISTIVAPTIEELIRIKMLKKNYMIPTNVIDCPISVKQQLYDIINRTSKYFLIRHHNRTYVCDVSFKEERFCIRNEKDAKYFLGQLVEGEYYSITDIITDKQEKFERGN